LPFFLENKRLYGILTLYYGREISEENYQKVKNILNQSWIWI
jgi:hypothetical protein